MTYQKSEKFMVWLPRNAKKCIFLTLFRHLWQKKMFFQKSGSISFLELKKNGQTDGRTYKCKSIVPPKFLGRSKNKKYARFLSFLCKLRIFHIPATPATFLLQHVFMRSYQSKWLYSLILIFSELNFFLPVKTTYVIFKVVYLK